MAIFTAELAKRDKYYATLDLPADKRQLQNAKWQARFSGESDESVSFFFNSGFPNIELPEINGDRLDEINYLAHRIDSLSEDERAAYKALLTTMDGASSDMKTLINMTYGLDRIIVSPATDFHMLGEHYIDNDLLPELEGIPESAVPFIDREAVGKLIAERNEGMFIDGMYVEIGDYVVPEEYDGEHIPDAESGDIRVSLINRDTGMINSFQFPVDPDTLKQITEKYDLEQIFDITDSSGNIRAGMIKSAADLDALNSLAEKLNAMTDEESIVFSAVMQSEDPATIDAMLDIAEHIGEYELDRDAMCYDDFGKEYLEAFLPEDFDPELLAKLAATGFGVEVAERIGATITDYGMISERGRQLSEIVYKEDKLPIIFDDAEENEAADQTEQVDVNTNESAVEQPTDAEQDDDPAQALTDEKLEVVEIFGQEALFTEQTIHDEQVPDGMYRYDFRSDGDTDFAAIERKVFVDRSGSILTREPIDFGGRERIDLDEESSPNFTGREMTLAEFAAIAVISAQPMPESEASTEEAPTEDAPTDDASIDKAPVEEAPVENASFEPVPYEEPTELFDDLDEDIPGFDPFPDDYPEAYFTLDEGYSSGDTVEPLPEDLLDFDPALVDYDEDDTLYYCMT